MTLATASETTATRRLRLRRAERVTLGLDAVLMAVSLGVCVALFASGGLEASLFALTGAAISARRAPRGMQMQRAYSGGFAGLFVGAVFAAFFHGALAAAAPIIL
jgi:hypothetical protein